MSRVLINLATRGRRRVHAKRCLILTRRAHCLAGTFDNPIFALLSVRFCCHGVSRASPCCSCPNYSETVNISADAATALLRHFAWNRERLFDQVSRNKSCTASYICRVDNACSLARLLVRSRSCSARLGALRATRSSMCGCRMLEERAGPPGASRGRCRVCAHARMTCCVLLCAVRFDVQHATNKWLCTPRTRYKHSGERD